MKGQKIFKRRLNLATAEYETVGEFFIDGNQVSEAEFELEFPQQRIRVGEDYRPTQFREIHSEACAYHPRQIPEAKEHLKKVGLGDTQIDSTGCPVFRDRQHRRRFLRTLGLVDRSSYYGY